MKTILILLIILFSAPLYAEDKPSKESVEKLWEEVLKEKKKYAAMEKNGASKKELALQKELINVLYKEMITQKKEAYGDKEDKNLKDNKSWQEMLKEKKKYTAMEKDGASKKDLAEQKKKIMALYKKAKSEK